MDSVKFQHDVVSISHEMNNGGEIAPFPVQWQVKLDIAEQSCIRFSDIEMINALFGLHYTGGPCKRSHRKVRPSDRASRMGPYVALLCEKHGPLTYRIKDSLVASIAG